MCIYFSLKHVVCGVLGIASNLTSWVSSFLPSAMHVFCMLSICLRISYIVCWGHISAVCTTPFYSFQLCNVLFLALVPNISILWQFWAKTVLALNFCFRYWSHLNIQRYPDQFVFSSLVLLWMYDMENLVTIVAYLESSREILYKYVCNC